MQRRISITFHDGFRKAAEIAAPILEESRFRASFYVVTGWVEPRGARIRDSFNKGRSHGDWNFWREVARQGHEVGSHSFSHLNARGRRARYLPWLLSRDIRRSASDLQREIPETQYTIAMPQNAVTLQSDTFVRRHFSACLSGQSELTYNPLHRLSQYCIMSWAPEPRHAWDDYARAIENLPDQHWLIFQFHSFDEEGWYPVSAEFFARLCSFIASAGLVVQPVRDVLSVLGGVAKP